MREELNLLRDELKALKDCQTRYIGIAVASVGAIFSYLFGNFGDVTPFDPFIQTNIGVNSVYLIPLVIILPISCIFFNKAVTVTRIVGYYQLLEDFNLGINEGKYIGWENSLKRYREYGRDREKLIKQHIGRIKLWEELALVNKIEYFFRIFGFNMEPLHELTFTDNTKYTINNTNYSKALSDFGKPQTYWELVYGTFFAMCALCFILATGPVIIFGIRYLIENISQQTIEYSFLLDLTMESVQKNRFSFLLIWIFLAVSICLFRYNLKTLYQLERGFHSYYANYIFWKAILIDQISEHDVDKLKNSSVSEEKINVSKGYIYDLNNPSKSLKKKNVSLKLILKSIPKSQKRMIIFFIIYIGVMTIIVGV
ncbi:hypothetical protein MSHOH_1432 [Methanosarcina horonobensis HB-1 = JCM 15518]|uniref:Uncharacterized protein n=2 Tax=Methanosarcina horonobensis TaxID=418008 RepID=A0A0E3WUF6_9EURY|nr:hypothetical protein MSHOH_1432 [Methanosarcina horonobensis HB-1 = JCM 15518]